ncbi:MAG TPA: hypothetical protein DEF45_02075 [Rhodopirellula sp.]|nr:hypothetical protein [Rhodopirellula sp.]
MRPITIGIFHTAFCVILAAVLPLASYANPADDSTGITFLFPEQKAAERLLSQTDAYTDTASAFDRKVRMGLAKDPGIAKFLEFVAAQVKPWSPDNKKNMHAAIAQLQTPLKSLSIKLDAPVHLIYTTGKEESGAAYTRGNEIVFPETELNANKRVPTRLMAHELFHVISRQHPILRDELYKLIGFKRANPIQLPKKLTPLRITNPDAPVIEHVMQITLSRGQAIHIAPMLLAKSDYNANGPANLFAYLSFKLMQVTQTPDGWIAEEDDGDAIFHSPNTADFRRQIGNNTNYIIHPEEILADNFALIMTNGNVVDSWLTEQMKTVIKTYFDTRAP